MVSCEINVRMWDVNSGLTVHTSNVSTMYPFICMMELSDGSFAVGGQGDLHKLDSETGKNKLFGFDKKHLARVNSFVELPGPGQIAFTHNNDIKIFGYRKGTSIYI